MAWRAGLGFTLKDVPVGCHRADVTKALSMSLALQEQEKQPSQDKDCLRTFTPFTCTYLQNIFLQDCRTQPGKIACSFSRNILANPTAEQNGTIP